MSDVVHEIKLRTDLVELVSGYVPLKQSGRSFKGLCPFHAEKTPSFTVDREKGLFRCWGCGVGGDCFRFVELKEGLSFNEAGELLARRAGLEWVRRGESAERRSERERLYDINALAERFFARCLEESPEVRSYLDRRGLRPETVRSFRLGYAPPGYEALLGWFRRQRASIEDAEAADLILRGEHGLRDRFVDRLMIPIFDLEGRTIAFGGRTLRSEANPKYLNSRETALFQKSKVLYGLHAARRAIPDAGFTIVVEGYMDLIALHQAGVTNAVASLGTAIGETHVGILRRYSSELVVCFDGDGPGMRAAVRGSAMFEAAGCRVRVARLPRGEDPDTFLRREGLPAFQSLLNQAEPLLDYQLNELRAGYNLSDPEARLSFVREAARTIAQSGSHLTRQEYAGRLTGVLDRLAGEWYPGEPHRALQARLALGQEINRLLRPRQSGDRSGGVPSAGLPGPTRSGRERAERYVLRAALAEDRWAGEVARRLSVGHFSTPGLAGVAAALLSGADGDLVERMGALREDPANAETVAELLMEEAPLSDEGLEEHLEFLIWEWKQQRKRQLLEARAREGFGAGDPRGEELVGLLAELGGRFPAHRG